MVETSVAVVHKHPMNMGGAESVFMHTLEALQDDYEVTAFVGEETSIKKLNKYYNTSAKNISIKQPSIAGVKYSKVENRISGVLSIAGRHIPRYTTRIFHWMVNRELDEKLIIYTLAESKYGELSIQYIHHPWYLQHKSKEFNSTNRNAVLDRVFKFLSPVTSDEDFPQSSLLLTNSEWTADDLSSIYGIKPIVCPPPVKTHDIPENSSGDCTNVITVGRLTPYKDQMSAIEIVEDVRKRGVDVSLSIVGPKYDYEYSKQVEDQVADKNWVRYHGEVTREKLVSLLQTHKFGLHCYRHEHFGIVVAEMVAAQVLPLVPKSGGQTEILNESEYLTWKTTDEAVDLLYNLCQNEDFRNEAENSLPNIRKKYNSKKFKKKMKRFADHMLKE